MPLAGQSYLHCGWFRLLLLLFVQQPHFSTILPKKVCSHKDYLPLEYSDQKEIKILNAADPELNILTFSAKVFSHFS